MSILLGLDIGTNGARAVAVDEAGALLAEASSEYPLYTPQPGWTEQHPEDWWRAAKETLTAVTEKTRESGQKIAGLGLTGQMHGAVFLDATGKTIRPAILWNDQRTAAQCETIIEKVGSERLLSVAGNPALTGFQAPKILWLADEEPENYSRLGKILLPKDYIRYKLTGEYATDVSDASGTLLVDVQGRDWSAEILAALDIPRAWLPQLYEGPEQTGVVLKEVASELGLPPRLPVAAGGGDNAAAAIGTGIVREGLVSSSIGTSGVVFAHTEEFRPDPTGRLHAFCHAVPGKYHLMGVTLSAGGSLGWWADNIVGVDLKDLGQEAGKAPLGAEGLIFLPYLAGERTPHMDPRVRGAFLGLATHHQRAHMSRAIMEGVVFSLKSAMDIMRNLEVQVEEVRALGGGARSALWRRIQCDILGMPIHRTTVDEGPAYGAALLAGIAAGYLASAEEAASLVALRPEITEPDGGSRAAYADYFAVYSSAYRQIRELTHSLATLADSGGTSWT